MTYKTSNFDEEFFSIGGYSSIPDGKYKCIKDFRLEDLSVEDANSPTGRGRETAAPRGYDAERVARIIDDGERVSASWFDVQYDNWYHNLLECKTCISEYKNGQTGRFKLWKKHHEKLLGASNQYPDTFSNYQFLIYTIFDDSVREVGKLRVCPIVIEALIDDWHQEHHETMGVAYAKQLSWTRLLSALELDIEVLRQNEVVRANIKSDQVDRLQSQVDYDTWRKNPFEDIDNPYPVCGPSCDIQH
jgi:hypothetical protein